MVCHHGTQTFTSGEQWWTVVNKEERRKPFRKRERVQFQHLHKETMFTFHSWTDRRAEVKLPPDDDAFYPIVDQEAVIRKDKPASAYV